MLYSIITNSGRYIPERIIKNEDFLTNTFIDIKGEPLAKNNPEIVKKFEEITEIRERRYVPTDMHTSDVGFMAAYDVLQSSGIDKESLDYIIVAHNFGDVNPLNGNSEMVPTIAARIKHKLQIQNPYTVAYDLPFGCPGWLQALIQADYYIKSGDAKRILVIGSEVLSQVSDPHDIDSMLYSDGAGAVILEAKESEEPVGIISHLTRSDTYDKYNLLQMKTSNDKNEVNSQSFLKMNGRKLYEFALNTVPGVLKECIEKSKVALSEIKKILIHQANAKMDYAILERFFNLYGIKKSPENIMPMTISELGNNSVATLPILFDMLVKNLIPDHKIEQGDYLVFASVGAGMNINAMVYKHY